MGFSPLVEVGIGKSKSREKHREGEKHEGVEEKQGKQEQEGCHPKGRESEANEGPYKQHADHRQCIQKSVSD
jgi:hypothetical protein